VPVSIAARGSEHPAGFGLAPNDHAVKCRLARLGRGHCGLPYGWVFFYQSKEFLDEGIWSAQLAGNAPIIVDRHTFELRVTGTAKPLEQYLSDYEKWLPAAVFLRAPQPPTW
jgi:hypothetical protein